MKYIVKSAVKFGGTIHDPGHTIDLTDADAGPLLAVGAVAPVVKAVKATGDAEKGKKE